MIVLGVADNHDAGAALVIEGRPVAAVNQERVSRVKNAGGLFLLLDPAWSKGKVNVVSVALDFVF